MTNLSVAKIIAACLLTLGISMQLVAQQPPSADPVVALRVRGLTVESRDALMEELRSSTTIKLVFACVPAGVLVFEKAQANVNREQVLQQVVHHHRAQDVQELTINRAEAESLCAEARNR